MRLSILQWRAWFLTLLPVVAALAACSNAGDPRSLAGGPHAFTAAERELVDEIMETHPGLLVYPMPFASDSVEPLGGVNLTVPETVVISEEFVQDVVELNQTRPIVMVQITSSELIDGDLTFLQELDDIEILKIAGPRIDDQSMRYITPLESLRSIAISSSSITDEGLASLAGLSQLQAVSVAGGKKVTGSGFSQFAGRVNLNFVNVMNTKFDDAGCEQLAKFSNLRRILAANTKITDQGLKHLSGLSNLEYLNVTNTAVTAKGVAELKKALPKLRMGR